jgi:hypothetical protein
MIQTDLSECFLNFWLSTCLLHLIGSLGVGAGILLKQRMLLLELT